MERGGLCDTGVIFLPDRSWSSKLPVYFSKIQGVILRVTVTDSLHSLTTRATLWPPEKLAALPAKGIK